MSVHDQCQASIYTLSLCRGHSWRVRLAKQETLTPPGHLVSPLFAGVRECPPWCSIVGATVTVHQFFCILLVVVFVIKIQYRQYSTVHNYETLLIVILDRELFRGKQRLVCLDCQIKIPWKIFMPQAVFLFVEDVCLAPNRWSISSAVVVLKRFFVGLEVPGAGVSGGGKSVIAGCVMIF